MDDFTIYFEHIMVFSFCPHAAMYPCRDWKHLLLQSSRFSLHNNEITTYSFSYEGMEQIDMNIQNLKSINKFK